MKAHTHQEMIETIPDHMYLYLMRLYCIQHRMEVPMIQTKTQDMERAKIVTMKNGMPGKQKILPERLVVCP